MQLKFWETWYNKREKDTLPSAIEYDQFICGFAEDFLKQHRELYTKDVMEYWRLFRQEQEKEWTAYKAKRSQ